MKEKLALTNFNHPVNTLINVNMHDFIKHLESVLGRSDISEADINDSLSVYASTLLTSFLLHEGIRAELAYPIRVKTGVTFSKDRVS